MRERKNGTYAIIDMRKTREKRKKIRLHQFHRLQICIFLRFVAKTASYIGRIFGPVRVTDASSS